MNIVIRGIVLVVAALVCLFLGLTATGKLPQGAKYMRKDRALILFIVILLWVLLPSLYFFVRAL